MALKSAWPVLSLAALALILRGPGALADEAGCLVVGAWDEARGEPTPVIEAVVSTIVNRARARGISVCDAVMDPAALTGVTPAMHEVFSEAARPHGNVTAQPHTGHDRDQLAAVEAAAAAALAGTLPDRSNRATHFYSPAGMRELGLSAAPRWAASMVHTATVGPFVFLREKGLHPPAQPEPARLVSAPVEAPAIESPPTPVSPTAPSPVPAVEEPSMASAPATEPPPTPLLPTAPPSTPAFDESRAASAPESPPPRSTAPARGYWSPPPPPPRAWASAAPVTASVSPPPSGSPVSPVSVVEKPRMALPPPPPPPPPPRSTALARGYWSPPPPPPRTWAPVADWVPPSPQTTASGYWSPEPGTLFACRGWDRNAILVAVNWRRVQQLVVSGVRCGM